MFEESIPFGSSWQRTSTSPLVLFRLTALSGNLHSAKRHLGAARVRCVRATQTVWPTLVDRNTCNHRRARTFQRPPSPKWGEEWSPMDAHQRQAWWVSFFPCRDQNRLHIRRCKHEEQTVALLIMVNASPQPAVSHTFLKTKRKI